MTAAFTFLLPFYHTPHTARGPLRLAIQTPQVFCFHACLLPFLLCLRGEFTCYSPLNAFTYWVVLSTTILSYMLMEVYFKLIRAIHFLK